MSIVNLDVTNPYNVTDLIVFDSTILIACVSTILSLILWTIETTHLPFITLVPYSSYLII